MSFTQTYARWFRRILPSPFTIALLLTVFTLIAALLFSGKSSGELLLSWQNGLWNSSLLTFAFQMMLMLVLGHVLALSDFFNRVTNVLVAPLNTTANAALVVCFSTILVAYLNWGLGLIFGAILARKIGEHFSKRQIRLNYPLIGAAGYVGLMVWHGGISGSSLVKVAESGHLRQLTNNLQLPEAIYFSDTVFSTMNIVAGLLILVILPLFSWYLGKREGGELISLSTESKKEIDAPNAMGAERIDQLSIVSKTTGVLLIVLAIVIAWRYEGHVLGFITPNYINFCLLALCILLHKNFRNFLSAVDEAIQGASGILIQFPLYFGILALLQTSGLIALSSEFFISISNETTFPLFTFFSAGLVNIFVPSGGGQWAIQGPIIVETATQLGVPLEKCIMALAYGDQLTNMLQPFWALPLLSITGLKAKDILPYTLLLMLVGLLIFVPILLLF